MKRWGLVTAGAATSFLVLVSAASPAHRDQTYNDPVGDAQGGAPDISLVTVSNDKSKITFRIVTNQAQLNPDSDVLLELNTDQDPTTGAPGTLGADYLFDVYVDNGKVVYQFGRWTGTNWDNNTPYSTVSVNYDGGATITVDSSEIGNTTAFDFWVRGLQTVSQGTYNVDDAPNDGTWTYKLQSIGATVTTIAYAPNPFPPRAGKPFTIRIVGLTLSTGRKVQSQGVSCVGKVGATKLLGSGTTSCRLRVPLSARKKVLTVGITAVYGASRKTVTFSSRVK